MASTSEITFGARLHRAEQLHTYLIGFVGYMPPTPDCAPPAYQLLINNINTNNTALITKQSKFKLAVGKREDIFMKSPDSLQKRLSPIGSYVKAVFGKTSPQAEMVVALVNKIRGEKTSGLSKNEEGEFVSQSYQSYGSKTQNFSDLIGILLSYGQQYNPPNAQISNQSLQQFLLQMNTVNDDVNIAYSELKPVQDARIPLFDELHLRTQRIKEAVKAQYGIQSSEYLMIKGLKI